MGVAAALTGTERERLLRIGSSLLRTVAGPVPAARPPEPRVAGAATQVAGRCSVGGGPDTSAVLVELTTSGFTFSGIPDAVAGQRVVAEFGRLGNMSGRVERVDGHMTVVANDYSAAKRAKVGDLVAWLADQDPQALADARRHARATPRNPATTVDLGTEGEPATRRVDVRDVSQSGAALKADFAPPRGTTLTFGAGHRIRARVVRHLDEGFAVEFLRILPVHRLDPDDGF